MVGVAVVGADVVGASVIGADVVGASVIGADVVGADVITKSLEDIINASKTSSTSSCPPSLFELLNFLTIISL